MGEVKKLELVTVGEGFRFEGDQILEAAKGKTWSRLAIIGELEDGDFYLAGTANAGETLILIELAKHLIVTGDLPGKG